MIWCSIRFLEELHKWLGDQTWGINGRCPPHFLRSYRSPFCSLESFICRWRSSMFAALKSCLPSFVFFFLVSTSGWMTGCYLWLCFSHHCFVLSSLSHFNLLLGTATASARGQEEKPAALGFKQSVVHRCHLLPDDIFVLFVGDVFQAKCSSISCSHMFTNGFLMISKYKPTRNDFTHKILDFSVLALLNLYHDYIRENNTLHHRM